MVHSSRQQPSTPRTNTENVRLRYIEVKQSQNDYFRLRISTFSAHIKYMHAHNESPLMCSNVGGAKILIQGVYSYTLTVLITHIRFWISILVKMIVNRFNNVISICPFSYTWLIIALTIVTWLLSLATYVPYNYINFSITVGWTLLCACLLTCTSVLYWIGLVISRFSFHCRKWQYLLKNPI